MNIILPNSGYEKLSLQEALGAIMSLPASLALGHLDKLKLGKNHLEHLEILREQYRLIAEWMWQILFDDHNLRLELLHTKGKQIDLIEPFACFFIAQRRIATTFLQRTGYSLCPNFLWVHMIGSSVYRSLYYGGVINTLSKSTCEPHLIKTKAEDISGCRKSIQKLRKALDAPNFEMPKTIKVKSLEDWKKWTDEIILCNSILYARNNADEEFYQEINDFLKTARTFIQTISKGKNAKEYQNIYSFIDGSNYITGKGKKPTLSRGRKAKTEKH